MRALLVALTFVVALLTTSNAGAVATPAPAAPTGVTVVKTGMYLNQIHEMNLKENFFVVDLYVWFRWKGDAKPNESFSFIDGRIEQSLAEHRLILNALGRRDINATEQAMREHISSGRRALARSARREPGT